MYGREKRNEKIKIGISILKGKNIKKEERDVHKEEERESILLHSWFRSVAFSSFGMSTVFLVPRRKLSPPPWFALKGLFWDSIYCAL
jgi:hypothetical protein